MRWLNFGAGLSKDLNLGISLFKGESKAPLKVLNKEMLRFAEQEEFENAGRLRDLISEISEFSKNFIEFFSKEGQRRDDVDLGELVSIGA